MISNIEAPDTEIVRNALELALLAAWNNHEKGF